MFTKFVAALRALRGPSQQEREAAYLNAAYDRIDLEFRQRQVDAGLFSYRSNYPNYTSTALN